MNNQLVSLKESIDAVDRRESLLESALGAYIDALNDVEKHIFAHWSDRPADRVAQLKGLPRRFRDFASTELFQESRKALSQETKVCGEWMETALAGSVDLKAVLETLTETAKGIRDRGTKSEDRFRSLSGDLSQTAQLTDITAIRNRINLQVNRLGLWVAELQRENQALLNRLETEVVQYRQRAEAAESLASIDPLTGLGNRRELERRVSELLKSDSRFCVVLLDLNRFKYINDKYGHLVGDEVLRVFASRVKNQTRQSDFAARWGGDEFILLLNCNLRDAMLRAQQMHMTVCGRYTLGREDRTFRLDVSASIGVAERKDGESFEDLVARADHQMYGHKTPA